MSKFCTECGTKIDENFKFCPGCGANIVTYHSNNHSEANQYEADDSSSEEEISFIVCDNCGEENSSANNICGGCGAKLKGAVSGKPIERKEVQTTKKEFERPGKSYPKQKHKAAKRKAKTQKKVEVEKEIDSKKIYLIAAVIGIFAIVVLVTTGVLDQNINSSTNQSTGSGIDLSNIQLINNLEAKLNANPDDTKTLLRLADLKFDSGFYENAVPLYKRYLEKFPENADARIDMGVCFYNIGNYDTAIKEMKKALEYEPKHQIGHLNLGVVNLTAGNVDVAKEWFQKAIELGPNTEVGKKAKNLLNSHNL